MTKNEKQVLRKELMDALLKDVETDDELFNRLLYALEIISNELSRFSVKD